MTLNESKFSGPDPRPTRYTLEPLVGHLHRVSYQHEPVIATFHTAGVTHECRERMERSAAEQLLSVLRRERPPRLVNPEVWPVRCGRLENIKRFSLQPSGG